MNGLSRTNVQRTTLGLQGEDFPAWSILHLWDGADGNPLAQVQRPWMNVGTSYTSNVDFMYTGLLERPRSGIDADSLETDAVIAWGCQHPAFFTGGVASSFRLLHLNNLEHKKSQN